MDAIKKHMAAELAKQVKASTEIRQKCSDMAYLIKVNDDRFNQIVHSLYGVTHPAVLTFPDLSVFFTKGTVEYAVMETEDWGKMRDYFIDVDASKTSDMILRKNRYWLNIIGVDVDRLQGMIRVEVGDKHTLTYAYSPEFLDQYGLDQHDLARIVADKLTQVYKERFTKHGRLYGL